MTTIIITAIIAFDCGMLFGCFWANREKDHEETGQEWLNRMKREAMKGEAERNKELIKRILDGRII